MARLSDRTVLLIVIYLVLALATQFFFQRYGTQYLDSALIKATASYALARGLNGVITVVQESSISVGIGVEGNFAVGQVLDPINDLIKHFSWIMLLSVISLGVQKLLVVLGVRAGLALFAAALGLVLLNWFVQKGEDERETYKSGSREKLLILAIFVQAAIPITSSIGAAVSDTFLESRRATAEAAISTVQQELSAELGAGLGAGVGTNGEDRRWFERLDPRNFDLSGLEPGKIVQAVTDKAGEMTSHVIDLMIVFIFQTLVMPLLTLWLLIQMFYSVWTRQFAA